MHPIYVAVFAACACLVSATQLAPAKDRLTRDLLEDYQPTVDPGNIQLDLGLALICARFEKSTGTVVSSVWEQHFWTDSRLTWTPSEYGGIDKIRVPSRLVWKPDTRLYNSITSVVERDSEVNVVVYSDGRVLWIPTATYRTLGQFGEDEITYKFKVGSWTYDGDNIILKPLSKDPLDLQYYDADCPSVVTSHKAEVVSHKYPCCEELYPSLDASVTLKPRQGKFDKSEL